MNFVLGVIFGIVVSTIGFSGVAKMLDSGVNTTKSVVKQIEVDKN
jgi:hypothetical protein